MLCNHASVYTPTPYMYLLYVDLAILFDVELVVALEGLDLVLWELGAEHRQPRSHEHFRITKYKVDREEKMDGETYVKPGMMVNSLVILPPWSLTFCFAAASSSLETPSFSVI
jgi:hypothetical protein